MTAIAVVVALAGPALAQPAASQPQAGLAPATQPQLTDAGRKNLKTLTDHLEDLEFTFSYRGAQDKPFYAVTLSVADFMLDEDNPFTLGSRITPEEGARIVRLLAEFGWLDGAQDVPRPPKVELGDGYLLQIAGYDRGRNMLGSMGFDARTYERLSAIRAAVAGQAGKNMDSLLGRISFLKAAPPDKNEAGGASPEAAD